MDFSNILLVLAVEARVLQAEDLRLDGTKIHADASKSRAVSYQCLEEIRSQLHQEVEQLLHLSQQADGQSLPDGVNVTAEIARRQVQLENLAQAHQVLEERAQQRYEQAQSEYGQKMARAAYTQQTGRQPRGRVPAPLPLTLSAADQYNFTDPDSRIMKNSGNQGFDQHYNAQFQ